MWARYFSQVLRQSFEGARQRNPSISLRAFARQLDVSASVLSEILRDKRTMSADRALRVAEKANLDPEIFKNLQNFLEKNTNEGVHSKPVGPLQVSDLILNPLYYRVLSAFEIFPVPVRAGEIAKFLKIEEEEFDSILKDLAEFDVVKVKAGQIYWQGRNVQSTEDIPSKKLREFHRETLKAAARDLVLPVEEREYTSVVFAGCSEQMAEAKKQIRSFRSMVSSGMRNSKPDQIFQLSIQLRPVSEKLGDQS